MINKAHQNSFSRIRVGSSSDHAYMILKNRGGFIVVKFHEKIWFSNVKENQIQNHGYIRGYFEGCWSNKVKSMIERSEWQKSKLLWWSKMNHQQTSQEVILHKHTQRDLEAGLVSERSRVKGVFGFYGYELWLAWVQLMTPFSSIYLAKWVYIS